MRLYAALFLSFLAFLSNVAQFNFDAAGWSLAAVVAIGWHLRVTRRPRPAPVPLLRTSRYY